MYGDAVQHQANRDNRMMGYREMTEWVRMFCCDGHLATVVRSVRSILAVVLAAMPSQALALDHMPGEHEIDVLINDARAARGLPRLRLREDLVAVARARSHDMATNSYIG